MSTEADAFFAPRSAERESDVVNGRYVLADPATKTIRTWTRASNIGAALADQFGLNRWRMRRLLLGLSARPDLINLLRAMVEPDNAKLDEIIGTALEVAGATESANQGTTIHEIQRRVHLGEPIPEDMRHFADAYTAALAKHGLTVVTTEVRVLNPALGAAGRLDVILREADGTLVVGDTKSTDHINLSAAEFAPQLAAYVTSEWVEMGGDGGQWTKMPEVRRDYAVCIHVNRETGAVAIYRVDMRLGAYAANLATQVREWRNTKGVLLPYVPPAPVLETALTASIPPVEAPAPTYTMTPDNISTTYVRPATDPVQQYPNAGLAPADPFAGGTPLPEPEAAPVTGTDLRSAAELTKSTKAQVQQYLRDHGMPDDLAHTKAILISRAVQHGKVRPDGTPAPMSPAGSNPPAADANGGMAAVDIPGTPEFVAHVMHLITTAGTVAQLQKTQQWVVRLGGDQAWTDQMTDHARIRANALDQHAPSLEAVTKVKACQSQEDLAQLWTELTIGGSRPEGWPAEVDAAARARLIEIQNAVPAAPANPFGN